MQQEENKSVLVTTAHRGVFWGRLEWLSGDGKTAILVGARNAIRWATTQGFLELAQVGPNKASKVGATAPRIRLHEVTSVTDCTDLATKAWESA